MTSKKQPGKLAQADFSDAEIAELIEYFLAFGEAIEVPDRGGKEGVSLRIQKSIRKQTADSIESLVKEMLAMCTRHRSKDGTLRRFLTRWGHFITLPCPWPIRTSGRI